MFKFLSGTLISSVMCVEILLTAFGATSKDLTVYYDGIKIFVDAKEVSNKNLEPFILNDVTFVPLCLISEALICKVDWKSDLKSIWITTPDPELVVLGNDGLYKAHSDGGSIKLDNKITPSARDGLGSFSGDKDKYNDFITIQIKQEQDNINHSNLS